ncbi:MAG: FAD binding domain-containing protein [Anaerolineaceae bacterium]
MKIWEEYLIVESLEQAKNSILDPIDTSHFIAGGTDLLLEIQQGRRDPYRRLVDVNQIPELRNLISGDKTMFIGAAVPVSIITKSELVMKNAMAISEATGLIGGPQVRNVATLGGNVAHALPAADGMIALVAMDATATILANGNIEDRPILSLFKGPGETTLQNNELIIGFLINNHQPCEGSAFRRIMRPQGVALPILNCAVWIKRTHEFIEDIRIVFGPSGPVPSRAIGVEMELRGKEFCDENLDRAIDAIRSTVKFRTSQRRATADYRYELAEDLLRLVVNLAWERTMEKNVSN